MSEPIYLTVEQVAQRLNTSVASIWRWKRVGLFPKAVKFAPGTTRWRLVDVQQWEAACETSFATHLLYPPMMLSAA